MRSYVLLLLALSIFGTSITAAQHISFNIQWGDDGMDAAQDIIETKEGNMLIAGGLSVRNTTNNYIYNGFLTLADKDGEIIWTKQYGGGMNDVLISVVEYDDAYMATGYTQSYSANGSQDVLLIKTDKNGNELWRKNFGGTGRDEGHHLLKLSDGNLLITGITDSKGAGNLDAWLLKVDTAGNLLWDETFGGTELDDAWDAVEAADGGYIFTGGTWSFATGSLDDGWIVKVDKDGKEQWRQVYGSSEDQDWFWSIEPTNDGNYVLTGVNNYINLDPRPQGLFFIKVNPDGELIWDKSFGLGQGMSGNDIKSTADGNYIIGGYRLTSTRFEFLFIKTNENGDTLWTKGVGDFQTVNHCHAVTATTEGSVIGAGRGGWSQTNNFDIMMVKVSDATSGLADEMHDQVIRQFANHLMIHTPSKGQLRVYNLQGQMLHKEDIPQGKTMFKAPLNSQGLLLVEVTLKNGETVTGKWIPLEN
ncbi:MAG: hypothetical protein WD077_00445 [Bacteroidia bacterium]